MPTFTDKFLRSLKPREKRYYIRESQGFAVRVQPSGRVDFFCIYTWNGRRHHMPLGKFPELKLADARRKHRDALSKLENDIDPKAARDAARNVATVSDLIDDYINRWAKPRKKSWQEDARNLEKDIRPLWGNKFVTEITRQDVLKMLERLYSRNANRQASIVFSLLRRMFNFAIEQGYAGLQFSPCDRIRPRIPDNRKDRVLTDEEIRTFWFDLAKTSISASAYNALRLILLTGQRPGEVLGMTWEEIDSQWWTIPANRSKTGRAHRVYLSNQALEILGGKSKGICLPSPRTGEPIASAQLAQALRRGVRPTQKGKKPRVQIEPFTPHDLRRTCATGMAMLGFPQESIGKLLGHIDRSVTGIYNRHDYDREKKKMAIAWGEHIAKTTC